jgi:hypothetical protein
MKLIVNTGGLFKASLIFTSEYPNKYALSFSCFIICVIFLFDFDV